MFQDIINLIIQRYSMDSYNIFDKIITIPFSLIFLGIFNLIQSYGLTIIVFTIITKIVLLPVSAKGKKSMMKQSRLSPKVAEIQKQFPNDRARQQQEIQKLYLDEGVSMTGCLWTLLPFPILIALYAVIRLPLTNLMGLNLHEIQDIAMTCFNMVYEKTTYGELELSQMIQQNFELVKSHFPNIMYIDFKFLGVDLTIIPSWKQISATTFIPILSGALSFLTSWLNQKMNPMAIPSGGGNNSMAGMTKSMLYTMPLVSVWIGFIMPAAMSLYWIINSITMMAQEYFLTKRYRKYFAEIEEKNEVLRAAERAKEEEERKKQAELREMGLTQKNPNTSKRKNVKEIQQPKTSKKSSDNNKNEQQKDTTAGMIDSRRYARGRSYVADRYDNVSGDTAVETKLEDENLTASENVENIENVEKEVHPESGADELKDEQPDYEDESDDENYDESDTEDYENEEDE